MADRHIGALPQAAALYDDSLLVLEQQGAAASLSGAQLKRYARQGVEDYVEDAKAASQAAGAAALRSESAAASAVQASQNAQAAQSAAEDAREGAERAQEAIEALEVEAVTLDTGQPASVEKTAGLGHVKLRFGLPAGKQGARGEPGSSIQKIERTAGTGAAGTVDTYTVTLTDGSTHDFQVTNGADGTGAGDMLTGVYDPRGLARDMFAYADSLLPVIHTLALPPEGWAGEEAPYTQTVPVPGVLADPAAQLIHLSPADPEAWEAAGLRCTAQGEDTLTFTARERPEGEISLLVSVQMAQGYAEGGESS